MTTSVLFWNIWGHRHPDAIHRYITANRADVCCLTEVTDTAVPYKQYPKVHTSLDPAEPPSQINGLSQLKSAFVGTYVFYYLSPVWSRWECKVTGNKYYGIGFGSAMAVESDVGILDTESMYVHVPDVRPRVLQCMVFRKNGKTTIVAHLHGMWFKENSKGDDPRRITQSRVVLAHLAMLARRHDTKRVVFGGDLNLDIGTEAIAIFERGFDGTPLKNLIREHGIKSTRTPRYRNFGEPGESRYADYVFVTPEIDVHEFSVDTTELASDHAPLRIVFR